MRGKDPYQAGLLCVEFLVSASAQEGEPQFLVPEGPVGNECLVLPGGGGCQWGFKGSPQKTSLVFGWRAGLGFTSGSLRLFASAVINISSLPNFLL